MFGVQHYSQSSGYGINLSFHPHIGLINKGKNACNGILSGLTRGRNSACHLHEWNWRTLCWVKSPHTGRQMPHDLAPRWAYLIEQRIEWWLPEAGWRREWWDAKQRVQSLSWILWDMLQYMVTKTQSWVLHPSLSLWETILNVLITEVNQLFEVMGRLVGLICSFYIVLTNHKISLYTLNKYSYN
jgi:hypothetical protein